MKTWTVALTAGLLVGSLPFATAEEPCTRAGPTEAMDVPGKPGSYLFFDMTQAAKVGEWSEKNDATGLQTVKCLFRSGATRLHADAKVPILG